VPECWVASTHGGKRDEHGLVGREAELRAATQFLDSIAASPGALVLQGPAGIGKTRLWRAITDRAAERGYVVLAAEPVQSEAAFSYAGLVDLFRAAPVSVLDDIPTPQRRALAIALLAEEASQADDAVPDPHAVAAGFLSAVRALAKQVPLVLAIDDAHWLDGPSAGVLSYLVRRLGSAPVGLVSCTRVPGATKPPFGLEEALGRDKVTTSVLSPMSFAATHRAIEAALGVHLVRPLALRVHRISEGNPLYAIEMIRALIAAGAELTSDALLQLPASLAELVSQRVGRLSENGQRVAVLVAAATAPSPELIFDVAGDGAPEGLDEAISAGVVAIRDGRVAFTQPLLASAANASIGLSERRRIHAQLARHAQDPETRAEHLAAAVGPDGAMPAGILPADEAMGFGDADDPAAIADAVEAGAVAARRRGSPEVAATLALRSAELTPASQVDDRFRRSLLAVRYLLQSGDNQRGAQIAEEVASQTSGRVHIEALRLWADTRWRQGHIPETIAVLDKALADVGDDALARAALEHDRVRMSLVAGDQSVCAGPALAAHLKVARASGDPAYVIRAEAFAAGASLWLGQGCDLDVLELEMRVGGDHNGLLSSMGGGFGFALALACCDELDRARRVLDADNDTLVASGTDLGRAGGVLGTLIQVEVLAGNLARAKALAEEATEVAWLSSSDYETALTLANRAQVHLAMGDIDAARRDADRAIQMAPSLGALAGVVLAYSLTAMAGADLAAGQAANAATYIEPIVDTLLSSGLAEPAMLRQVPLCAEVLIALGRVDEADELISPFEQRARSLDRRSSLGLAGRVRGLMAASRGDWDHAVGLLIDAAATSANAGFPLDGALSLMALGRVRRRSRDRRAAADTFEAARAIFGGCGAHHWADKADEEIRRVGLRRSTGLLTSTEAKIARLAASGLSNAEIAEVTFLSPNTVRGVLSRVFNKLGTTSRQELAARLGSDTD
jgi:DNA-binding CsgD family transcriptional regulator